MSRLLILNLRRQIILKLADLPRRANLSGPPRYTGNHRHRVSIHYVSSRTLLEKTGYIGHKIKV